jgi:hypothetical protein
MGRGIDWIDKAHDRNMRLAFVSAGMNSLCSIKCGEFLD